MTATVDYHGIEFDVDYEYIPEDPTTGLSEEYIIENVYIDGKPVRWDNADTDLIIDGIIRFENETWKEAISEGHTDYRRKHRIY
jgi:hypothetical protein